MKLKSLLVMAFVMLAGKMNGQILTNTAYTAGQKYPLLEEGTGTWCGYCPDGAQKIEQTIEPGYPNCIAVAFHNGGSDAMTLPGDPFNTVYITGFPGGAVDRHTFGGVVEQGRGNWAGNVGTQVLQPVNFDVMLNVAYDTATRVATIKVLGKALQTLTGQFNVNCYIVEDSISSAGAGYEQHSYMYATAGSWYQNQCTTSCGTDCTSCANLPDTIYSHMNVVKDILGADMWGDPLFTNPTMNDTMSKIYTFNVPLTYRSKFLKAVGIVQAWGPTGTPANSNAREIQNAIRSYFPVPCSPVTTINVTSVTNTAASFDLSYYRTDNRGLSKGFKYIATTSSTAPASSGPASYSTTANINLTGLTPNTNYYLWVLDSCEAGTRSNWTSKPFKTSPLAVTEMTTEEISLNAFPSPVSNTLNIAIGGIMTGDANITLTDVSGKVIRTIAVTSKDMQVDMQSLPSGIYLVRYADAIHRQTIRINKD